MKRNIMNRLLLDNMKDIKALCERYDVKSLYVFGSACSQDFSKESDIDILIAFKDIPIDQYTDHYFEQWG